MQTNSKKKYPVKRMNISINMEKTGSRIKRAIKESGYTIREIMEITGITTEQTIYKWYSGKSIPSLETQIILCKLLDLQITELLVLDGEFDLSRDKKSPDDTPSAKRGMFNQVPAGSQAQYCAGADCSLPPVVCKKTSPMNRQPVEISRRSRLTAYYQALHVKTA